MDSCSNVFRHCHVCAVMFGLDSYFHLNVLLSVMCLHAVLCFHDYIGTIICTLVTCIVR